MRVCVLIDAWEPLWGGGPKNTWEISRRLAEYKKWNIDVFTRSLKENGSVFNATQSYYKGRLQIFRVGPITSFFNIFSRLVWLIAVCGAVWVHHSTKPYDVIHAHAYSAGIPGKILSLLLHVPIVFTVHGSNNLDLHKKTLTAMLERFILTKIFYDQEISVSHSFLQHSNVNIPIVIPNGVERRVFDQVKDIVKRSKKFTFLFVGRFDAIKGVVLLIEAFSDFHKKYANTQLLLIGYGFEERKIINLIKQLHLEDSIIIKGKLVGKPLMYLYKLVDVVVLPSLSEGQPVVILEAFAAKKPIIATDVGDVGRLIKSGKTGFLIQPSSINALHKALVAAYHAKNLKSMGINGYKIVQQYEWDTIAAKTAAVYESLIK